MQINELVIKSSKERGGAMADANKGMDGSEEKVK